MIRGQLAAAIKAIVQELFPRARFAGDFEFSVVAQAGAFVDLRPTDASLQLPSLKSIPFRGSAGVSGTLYPGTKVIVRFVNSDPGRPYVASVMGEDDSGHVPSEVRIVAEESVRIGSATTPVDVAGAHGRVIRSGDAVLISGFVAGATPITPLAPTGFGIIQLSPLLLIEGPPQNGLGGAAVIPPAGYSGLKA